MSSRATRTKRRASSRTCPMGCGVDVVELTRFRAAVKRWGDAFLERVFTDAERTYAQDHRAAMGHLAARFAAKEAVVKAMAQVDPARPLTLKAIEIRNDELGRPFVVLEGFPEGHPMIHVSLSHSEHIALACAIVNR